MPLFLSLALTLAAPAADDPVVRNILPSRADPAVTRFDDANVAVSPPRPAADAPLVVFLPGTGGKPANTLDLLKIVAGTGARTLGLQYDNTPAVSQICPRDPDPNCAAAFREMRSFGTGGFQRVRNIPAEAIVPRLVAALRALGWSQYLDGAQPRWDRIVVSGLSQGAGMAAYIAKRYRLRGVVLFSSPWDVSGPGKLAPWLSSPSATPPARWQAAYHRRENTAGLLARAYPALAIPAANIRVFDLDLPSGSPPNGPNPFHPSTVRNIGYAADWRAMYAAAEAP